MVVSYVPKYLLKEYHGIIESDYSRHSLESGGQTSFNRLLAKTAGISSLCVLMRITTAESGVNLADISRTADLSKYHAVPVARSYGGGDWERVAGPYAGLLSISGCDTSSCILEIPVLPNLVEGKFILMSFYHSPSREAQVSRFLHKTTFGPTLEMINSFAGGDLAVAKASWVNSQINSVDATSHREYFRKRVDVAIQEEEETAQGQNVRLQKKVRSPCDAGSRWTEYAFTTDDYDFGNIAASYAHGGVLITVNGVARTVMTEWVDDNTGQNLRTGAGWLPGR